MSLSELVFATDEELEEVEKARIAFEQDMFIVEQQFVAISHDASTEVTDYDQNYTRNHEKPCCE
jgi:hypothetical protein